MEKLLTNRSGPFFIVILRANFGLYFDTAEDSGSIQYEEGLKSIITPLSLNELEKDVLKGDSLTYQGESAECYEDSFILIFKNTHKMHVKPNTTLRIGNRLYRFYSAIKGHPETPGPFRSVFFEKVDQMTIQKTEFDGNIPMKSFIDTDEDTEIYETLFFEHFANSEMTDQ
ncbi:hypothetical protein M153_14100018017 [Pseudoloma neurophilia]|uniref:Uncharacterized protein n=1 Tax=Pseudoloma neurophilia TaxID=146866 RepID=A0A0R0LZR6_9MICR|nr:hypothetical protein M153_14100018017 [Pseudoloma neurophilia]